jgi:hypothetical protein
MWEDGGGSEIEHRRRMVREQHRNDGHLYYNRMPTKPTHMKRLTQLDYYVI